MVSNIHRIALNTLTLLVAQAIGYVLTFLYMMLMARYLGPTDFGILSFAIAFTSIFSIFGDFGLQTYMTREMARDPSLTTKFIFNIGIIKIIVGFLAFGLMVFTINIMGYSGDTLYVVYLLGASVIFGSFSLMYLAVYQSHERMIFQGIGQVLNSCLLFVGIIIAINANLNITGIAFIYAGVNLIVLVYHLIITNCAFSVRSCCWPFKAVSIETAFIKTAINQSIPFGLIGLSMLLYAWVDTVILSMMKGEEAVGLYSAAYRLIITLSFTPAALLAALYPVMSRYYKAKSGGLFLAFEKAYKYLAIIAFPIMVGTFILAERFILIFYGDEFIQAAIALKILIFAVLFIFLNMVFTTLMYAVNRQKAVMLIILTAALINCIFNIALIPMYSYMASSIIRVGTESIMFILLLITAYRTGFGDQIKGGIMPIMKMLLASLIMGAFILSCMNLNIVLLVLSSAVVYSLIILVLHVLDKNDLDIFKQILGNKMGH
jgi:O-antigen/teichoic acid export membrane protein